jgi:hypothetical protein
LKTSKNPFIRKPALHLRFETLQIQSQRTSPVRGQNGIARKEFTQRAI